MRGQQGEATQDKTSSKMARSFKKLFTDMHMHNICTYITLCISIITMWSTYLAQLVLDIKISCESKGSEDQAWVGTEIIKPFALSR